jgi:hypothetical protein
MQVGLAEFNSSFWIGGGNISKEPIGILLSISDDAPS